MADVLDLSDARTVVGATSSFTCRKWTNRIAAAYREAEREADKVSERVARAQKRFEKDDEITNAEAWEKLEAENVDARLATLVPLLIDDRGQAPNVDQLRDEFSFNDCGMIVANCIRPTVPAWATTRSNASA